MYAAGVVTMFEAVQYWKQHFTNDKHAQPITIVFEDSTEDSSILTKNSAL